MHVMCVRGNLAPTAADMVLAGDRGRFEVVGVQRDDAASLQFNTLWTGLLNCLNARSRGLTFRHRASCI